ncbi:hypothetical protein CAEBREN_10917 [Caenorhabditis brenneri]|uniref:N-acetyltransferase domain-containing protein n=1 Tax=Caenorhabditis brenneri TaxID=135651 RepID=G0NHS9_CAEBE|nr:hypothetical protein CAEBREN_10917 [Caenorhabditis brenneri]
MPEFETLVNPPQEVWDQAVKMSAETDNWNFQSEDYKLWSETYGQFWLVTAVEKGTLNFVASVSLARWDGDDGPLYSIGMFYCVPKYRGLGLCKPIFQTVMDIIGDKPATLTGAVKMSAKYAKVFGFDKCPEHWHVWSDVKLSDVEIPKILSEKYSTKVWTEVDYGALTYYDRTICIRDRKKIMAAWFNLPRTFTRVVSDVTGKIVGYGTIRFVGNKRLSCAPYYADNLEAAEVLLKDLLENIPDWKNHTTLEFLYPECNKDPLRLLGRFAKSKEVVSTKKFCRSQFTKILIPTPDEKVYSLSDFSQQYV